MDYAKPLKERRMRGRACVVQYLCMDLSEVKLKQEAVSVAQAGLGFAISACVLAGICGTIYKLIAPDGWIAMAFGKSLSAGAATVGSLLIILGLAWFSRSSPRQRSRLSDLVVYGFAAAGFFYLVRLAGGASL